VRSLSGVVTAIVKDLDDPKGLGRVQLEFPWLEQSYRTDWVPIATPLTGKKRGQFFMPEIDDEALVAFEHGDFDHPFIIGFLWNGVDTPPDDGITTSVRRLRTVSGHVVEFDDRDGMERILIQTKDKEGHQIEISDTPPAYIKIRTRGGPEGAQEIKLADTPPSVTIETSTHNQITISNLPPTITIKTAAGSQIMVSDAVINISTQAGIVNVDCALANISAKSLMSVVAPVVQFSGTVLAPTLIAGAIVGSAYTPAPGNTFGL
jgi:uncharacterized protein involved in type VI secretion and phage assembly